MKSAFYIRFIRFTRFFSTPEHFFSCDHIVPEQGKFNCSEKPNGSAGRSIKSVLNPTREDLGKRAKSRAVTTSLNASTVPATIPVAAAAGITTKAVAAFARSVKMPGRSITTACCACTVVNAVSPRTRRSSFFMFFCLSFFLSCLMEHFSVSRLCFLPIIIRHDLRHGMSYQKVYPLFSVNFWIRMTRQKKRDMRFFGRFVDRFELETPSSIQGKSCNHDSHAGQDLCA